MVIRRSTAGFLLRSLFLSAALGLICLLGAANAQDFVQDEVIVVFAPGVDDDQREALHQNRGHRAIKNLRGVRGQVVKLRGGRSVAEGIADYQGDPRVRFAEPNYIVRAVAVPNDTLFGLEWGLHNTGQNILGVIGTAGADIDAARAWNITTGSDTIVVGVVDTGIDYLHPDLTQNIWTNPGGINGAPAGTHGYNAIANGFNPMDDNGHGSHVAGTVGGRGNNATGVAGVNWRVSMMALKFLDANGNGNTGDAIEAIDFAIDAKLSGVNLRVLNNSWGGGGFSQALLEEIEEAGRNDILFVAAAGNAGSNNDLAPFYPANYNAANIIAVAATDNRDLLAGFSNYGANSVELGAPGVNIASTYPNNSYVWSSGTSMAAPHVAGAAALVLANGYQSVSTLRNTLITTVDPLASLAGITITGGRLNVYNALLALAVSVTPESATLAAGQSLVLTATAAGGTAPYTYSWSDSSGPLGQTGTTITVNIGDVYSCTVTDSSVPPKIMTGSATVQSAVLATPVITWPAPAAITYGTALSSQQLNATANVPGVFDYNPPAGTVLGAGQRTLSVTFTPNNTAAYRSVTTSVSLTVQRAPLQVQANNASKLYGAAVPPLAASYSGFVNGDTTANLTTQPTLTTTATTSSPVGSYPITVSGATAANYTISFVNGTLTVNRAPLTITAANKTKSYKASMPTLTVVYTGFVNGDTSSRLTTQPVLSTTATVSSPVGVYPITVTGATAANYTITFVDGTLTINPLALRITATNKSKNYGAAVPTLTASYIGFASGETVANLATPPVLSTTATASSPVGVYPITVSGATSSNYTITFVNGTLTVNPATLTIYAIAKSKTYGAAMPALTASYSGFVNGETVANLVTPAVLATTATQSSPVGPYPITVSGATIPNYNVRFVNSTLTVRTATLSIRAVAKSKYYGGAVPALTYTVSGLVLGETEAVLTSPVTLGCEVTVASAAGTYPIVISGGTAPNYTVVYYNAAMTVRKAALSIRASSKSKVYGAAMPTLTYTVTGFVLGETEAVLLTPVVVSSTGSASSNVGSYPITVSGATAANYAITFSTGALSVTRAPLSVRADNKTRAFGTENPPLTYTIVGFVNGDTEANLDAPVLISTTATVASAPGSYYITPSGAVDANYTISFVRGTLTVTP